MASSDDDGSDLGDRYYSDALQLIQEHQVPIDFYRQYQSHGCLRHQAKVRAALRCGYDEATRQVIHEDQNLHAVWSNYVKSSSLTYTKVGDPKKSFFDTLQSMLCIPHDTGDSLLQAMLDGSLASYLVRREKAPVGINFAGTTKTQKATIYVLVHCDENGQTPTPNEYERVVEKVLLYNDCSSAKGHRSRDQYAKKIDYISCVKHPHLPRIKDWSSSLSATIHDEWKEKIHPRRYAGSKHKRGNIRKWAQVFRERIQVIQERDSPLPWSLVNVGWTKDLERRTGEHYKHLNSSYLMNLIEAVTFLEFPTKKYFMRIYPVMDVPCVDQVRSEHIISILTASYSVWGGLNVMSGSTAGTLANAMKSSPETWESAQIGLIKSGVYERNVNRLNGEVKFSKKLAQSHELEDRRLKAVKQLQHLEKELPCLAYDIAIPQADSQDLILKNAIDKKGSWAQLLSEVDEVEKLLQLRDVLEIV